MNEKLQAQLEKAKGLLNKINKKAAILVGLGVVMFAVVIAVVLNSRPYEVLATGLSTEEASAIVSKLTEYGATDYKIEGSAILVPKAQEADLKAKLLMDGYPKSGFGYDVYFNNTGMMATESDRKTVSRYELQDRMGSVIRALDGVKEARVTITEGEDRRYVLDSENVVQASASVIVTMQDGGAMPENYAQAIRTLVSRSVKGLEFDSIGITDSQGNSYTGDTASDIAGSASALKLNLENQVNNRIRAEVIKTLSPIYGEQNVRVSVYSTVDVSHKVQESVTYGTPAGAQAGEGIIGSRVIDQELVRGDGANNAGGVVGTENNSDVNTYMNNQGAVNGNETYIKNGGETNYNVDTSKQQSDQTSGVVTDVSIAVTINQEAAGAGAAQLTDHIARAAGISVATQNDKISVLVAPFYNETDGMTTLPTGLQVPKMVIYIAAGVVALLIAFILLLLVLSKKRRKKARLATAGAEPEPDTLSAQPKQEDVLEIRNEKSMELKQNIRKFTEANPEIAAQMLKTWLKGDGHDG